MRVFILTIYLLVNGFILSAQNLVPNPGFDDYLNCPVRPGDVPRFNIPGQPVTVRNWINPAYSTPDYFNACAVGSSNVGVPENYAGSHTAFSGNAYAGLITYFKRLAALPGVGPLYEYLQIKLTAPLLADSLYDVSCYVKLPNRRKSVASNISYAIGGINAALSVTPFQSATGYIDVPGALQMKKPGGGYITDSTEWALIYGTYTAKGNEEWLTIGITDSLMLNVLKIQEENPNVPPAQFSSYYLIDDVTVTPHIPCDTVINTIDTNLCTNGKLPATLFSNAPGTFKRKWNTGDTTRSIVITTPGTYWCTATAGLCNVYVDSYHVVYPIDSIRNPMSPVMFCNGETYTLSATTAGRQYLWSTGGTTRNIEVTNSDTYTCYITTANCEVVLEEFAVTTTTPPSAFVQLLNDTSACNSITIGWNYNLAQSYRWNTGDTVCCKSISKTGTYAVTISTDGCPPFTDTVNVAVFNCENCLSIPSAFSPNNDGLNDLFKAIPYCTINQFSFRIYNRWGQQVFYTTDPRKGWNGMHGAHLADIGTYFYLVEYNTVNDEKMKMLKGDIALLR